MDGLYFGAQLASGNPVKLEYNTFIANRVQTFQDTLKLKHWNHVSIEDNPADLATRGVSADLHSGGTVQDG